ncbi:MAG: Ppx/GppA family phosphatase [Caulobacterales bacterium]
MLKVFDRRAAKAIAREVAVIDVGSNSVRLVVYRVAGLAMTPILNEKAMAALGRGVSPKASPLPDKGVRIAFEALTRFRTIIDGLGVKQIEAVATSAVREAVDGVAFAARVRKELNIPLRIIDGAEEARLSALGVLASAPQADGVVADLGGSSLELIRIGPKGPGAGETHLLGPLALAQDAEFDPVAVEQTALRSFNQSGVLDAQRGDVLYAVGGAWRSIGRIDMSLTNYPLRVLQNYEMSRSEILKLCAFIAKQSKRSLERLEDAAAKRADTLPAAAVVLETLIRKGGFKSVILSSYGLREGLLLNQMSAEDRAYDPLLAGVEALVGSDERALEFGDALEAWLEPIFEGLPQVFSPARDRTLRQATYRLADLAGVLHPDHRADIAFEIVLRGPYAGARHEERAFLAAAIARRYARRPPDAGIEVFERLLSPEAGARAQALGAALRLGADISGRSPALLRACPISLSNRTLRLDPIDGYESLVTDQIRRRLTQLSEAISLTTV